MNDTSGNTVRRALARWLGMGALALAGLQLPAGAQAKCELKVAELPVKMVGVRAIATVEINGTSVPLMVDTGAFFSFLTPAAAAQLKLHLRSLPPDVRMTGIAGKVDTARLTRVEHLKMAGSDMPSMEFIVGGNEMGSGTMGILGLNILSFADTEYDLAHGMIRLVVPSDDCEKSDMAYWAHGAPVSMVDKEMPSLDAAKGVRAEVQLNGHAVTALFDSGATTVVSLHAAHAAGLKDADMTPAGFAYGAGSGKTGYWTASFDTVKLGGETVRNNRLGIGDFDSDDFDMLLGIDFFLSHRIYMSKQQSRVYFTYNGGPVFAHNVDAPASSADAGSASADTLTADELARRGAASLSRGSLAAALQDLDRACAMAPGDASCFATRAAVHLARRERELALADLDTALRLDPGLSDARLQRVSLHARGERELALDDLSALDRSLAPQSQMRLAMANVYTDLGLGAQALAQWNLWIAAHPNELMLERGYDGRCLARVELGVGLDKALDDCNEALAADSKNPAYASHRGWLWLRQGKLDKALADFDHALAGKSNLASALYGRGEVHLRLGQAALGEADLGEARQAQPDIDAEIRRRGLPLAEEAAR